MIYLDNNATTAALPEVVDTVVEMMTRHYSNPSSAHHRGRIGQRALRIAREQVSRLVGCRVDEVVFTSGGTEGNNAILASVEAGATIIYSAGDHASIVEPARRYCANPVVIPMLASGLIDLDALDRSLRRNPRALIATSWVNGETGVIQPVDQIAEIAKQHGARLLLDAAQAIGRLPVSFAETSADYLTFSGHKIHGPQGTGVMVIRQGSPRPSCLSGGGQEGGLRAGTENLPGIAGLGVACDIRRERLFGAIESMASIRDAFEKALRLALPEISINGSAMRVCNTSNVRFSGIEGQALLAHLDRAGICCSQASACSARRPEPSRALMAMGLDETAAFESLRFSFSVLNSEAEIPQAIETIAAAVSRLHSLV
jgi:cysteine desulfurase